VTVPSAPHRPGFAFFDVYRIPNTAFGVIVLMDFLYRHRTSFRLSSTSRRTRVGTSLQFAGGNLRFGAGKRIGTFQPRKQLGNGIRLRKACGVTSFVRPMRLMGGVGKS
jgi:hypothetical protein